MTDSVLAIIAVALVAGGGTVLVDAFVIRKIRQLAANGKRTDDQR